MNTKKIALMALALCAFCFANGQDEKKVDLTPNIHGTLRGKYEYQTQENEGRFEVRTARVSVDGYVAKAVSYKAEIDLCDEGNIKMLDAYTKFGPFKGFDITIGQMRVPFTIDVIRSPHQQYFANRSFIAKQVANVRDVGASVGYSFNVGFPIIIQLGMFNGSGLTNQKDFWTNNINFTAKAQFMLPRGYNITLSTQKIKPDNIDIMMYDAGTFYQAHGWHIEAEYLFKHYAKNAFKNVHAVDAFINYDIPLRKCIFSKISPLLRYDFMSDHSDGIRYLDGEENTAGSLIVNDSKRSRITGGVTFSISKPFISDIRLNYEKYFYGHDGIAKTSERDKIVIEVMTRF